jgi:murein DD-endopeptidase MepM/ murein hydrolase activator NlpD
MYRFPDPLDESALKGLIADKRFQDPRHPEHEFFKTFVAKAFELVHPDGPRDAAGRTVVDPRDPPQPQVVQGGKEFSPDQEKFEADVDGLGSFQTMNRSAAESREDRKSGLEDFFPQRNPAPRLTWPVKGRRVRDDGQGAGRFGRGLRKVEGTDERRDHEGLDIDASAGEPVVSPLSGRVVRESEVYGDMRGIAVANDDGDISRLLYVKAGPDIRVGTRVKAGQVIGSVQDIAAHHAKPGKPPMTNHIHIEILKRKDGSKKQPGDFSSKERHRDYEARDPWLSLFQSGE